jgi:hypothetical protein
MPVIYEFPQVSALAVSADGALVAECDHGDEGCWVWRADTGETVGWFGEVDAPVKGIAFAPHGRIVALAGPGDRRDLRRGPDSERPGAPAFLHLPGGSVGWSADGRRVVAGDDAGVARVYDAQTGGLVAEIDTVIDRTGFGQPLRAVALNADGSTLVGGAQSGTVASWNVRTGQRTRLFTDRSPYAGAVAVSPDGDKVAAGNRDGQLRVWRLPRPRALWPLRRGGMAERDLPGHVDAVTAIAFDATGARLVSGARDGSVRVIRVADGAPLGTLAGLGGHIGAVGFTGDGVLAADGDCSAAYWPAGADRPRLARRTSATGDAEQRLSRYRGSAWLALSERVDWPAVRCACGRGGRHLPDTFARVLEARDGEEAERTRLAEDIHSGGMLFEAAVPMVQLVVAAMTQEQLEPDVYAYLFKLLNACLLGEPYHTEVDLGRPHLELECLEAVGQLPVPLIRAQYARPTFHGGRDWAQELMEAYDLPL